MYIIIKNDTQKAIVLAEKQMTSNYLGCHRHTLTSNIEKTNPWRREKETVYYTDEYYGSNKTGNKDSYSIKTAKKNREIPRNKDKNQYE